VVARGGRWPDRDLAWQIVVPHPWRRDERLGTFSLSNQALATSGIAQQSFFVRGRRYGHVLDPRTGWPAEELLSATVVTSSATHADALATACFVLGVEGTRQLCQTHPEIGAFLVQAIDGELRTEAFNLPSETLSPVL
jgi:thiamine biosynthesis lipoprotein